VRSLVSLSQELGMKVVAEGIETAEQLEFARLKGCDEGQGHFIGMPKPINEIGSYWTAGDDTQISAA
jgi:EAL domain-containing protein (putative c-di-GMP-specific phosphodiesterase class I)